MKFFSQFRVLIIAGVAVAALVLIYLVFHWEFERVEVKAGEFLVKINLWGKNLPEGEIVAPDPSYKGIQKEVLPEGRHFLNPFFYTYKVEKTLEIPIGQCAVLTHKAGKEISLERRARGEFLAERDADGQLTERGIVREVLLPGRHRLNPYVYSYELMPATQVKANQVGVRTLRWGNDADALDKRKSNYVVPEGFRGVQAKPVPPGDYYLNPYVESIFPVNIDLHQVEFADIYFPSRDGFTIQPHVRVAYKVIPEKAPELFVMLCDGGNLSQADTTAVDKNNNPILQKFVLPLIRGWVRIEGSKYEARDYVSQQKGQQGTFNPREELRRVLEERVKPQCQELGVMIESITVAELTMNPDLEKLAAQIFIRETTRASRQKNAKLVDQATTETEQKGAEALRERESRLVDANRDLKVAKTLALQQKEVEEAKLENELKAAQARLEGAKADARAAVTRGKAEAAVTTAQNEAEVAGLKTAVAGFPTPEYFAQYHVMQKLSPALSEIFASDSSDFAKLFATYMNHTKNGNGKAPKRMTDVKK